MGSASREQYRRLAATLHHQQADRGIKVVMIASAVPGEGKTLTAANLGLTLSESYKRNVLLIDADLRRPALHTVFGTDNTDGLSEGLSATTERKLPARRISERLALADRRAAEFRPDGESDLRPDAASAARGARRLRLDHHRYAASGGPAGREPALVDGGRRGAWWSRPVRLRTHLVKRAVEAIGKDRILGVVLNRRGGRPAAQLLRIRYFGDDRQDARRIAKAHDPTADATVHPPFGGVASASRRSSSCAAVGVAAYLRLGESAWEFMRDEGGVEKALLIAAVSQICLYYVDLYDLRIVSDRRELFVRIVQALGAASFILAAVYFWFPTMIIGRGVFMIAAFLVLALVIGWRVVVRVAVAPRRVRVSGCCSSGRGRRPSRWRVRCSSGDRTSASRSSASSIRIPRWSVRRCSIPA